MLDGEAAFLKGLEGNADQTAIIDALFQDSEFLQLWNFLKNCPVKIKLLSVPGLKDAGGPERYGEYDGGANPKTLTINPAKPEHASNAAELADTLIHELIHAALDLKVACPDLVWPLPPGATDWNHDPTRPDPTGGEPRKSSPDSPNKQHAKRQYGDGASDPDKEYVDENDEAQEYTKKLVLAAIRKTADVNGGVRLHGWPSYVFINLRKLRGVQRVTKNWSKIRAMVWDPDRCWQRTSTRTGWVMKCGCRSCAMLVRYDDGHKQVDLIGGGDTVAFDGRTVEVNRLAGWEL